MNKPAMDAIYRGIREGWSRDRILDEVVAALHAANPKYHWVGIYLLVGDVLVLGPYRGKPTIHTRIPIGEGICGLAARTRETVNVPDVRQDPRYIACSLETRSEIVVPILDGDCVYGEIDIDSDDEAAFDETDREQLEEVARLLVAILAKPGCGKEGARANL
ncbi:MAG: GAF domain-containing protein [Anaerolineae bacterium]|nr:GAF domain-containing protein [Anaerolineae bacterium]